MSPELSALVDQVVQAMRQRQYPGRIIQPLDEAGRLYWRAQAIAAIRAVAEATREPTDGILNSLAQPHVWTASEWRAMHAASVLGEALRDE